MQFSELYSQCNRTELYQIARGAGIVVPPNASREELLARLEMAEPMPPAANEFDEWRMAIMGFVIDHAEKLRTQLKCPAKTLDPRACFHCVDPQVVSCLEVNQQAEHLIRAHKKPLEQPIDTTGDETMGEIENAPRTLDGLKHMGIFSLRKLANTLAMFKDKREAEAWGNLPLDKKCETVFAALTALDGQKKEAGQPAASPPSTPTEGTPSVVVAPVDPGALGVANEATKGPPTAGRRTRAPQHANGTANGAASATEPKTDPSSDLIKVLETQDKILAAMEQISTRLGALEGAVKGLTATSERMAKDQVLAFALGITIAQEVNPELTSDELLEKCIEDAESVREKMGETEVGAEAAVGKAQ